MMQSTLARLEQLLAAASPGHWHVGTPTFQFCCQVEARHNLYRDGGQDVTAPHAHLSYADAGLITFLRNSAPDLVAEIRRLMRMSAEARPTAEASAMCEETPGQWIEGDPRPTLCHQFEPGIQVEDAEGHRDVVGTVNQQRGVCDCCTDGTKIVRWRRLVPYELCRPDREPKTQGGGS